MADTGFGLTITFQSGFLAEIIDVTLPEWARDAIETTHTTTANGDKTFIPSDLIDNGEIGVQLNFDETAVPPIDQAASACVINFPSGHTWTCSAFLTKYGGEAPIDDRMTADCTIKITGGITIA